MQRRGQKLMQNLIQPKRRCNSILEDTIKMDVEGIGFEDTE
jgi:predicted Ser/Thr protein kinase